MRIFGYHMATNDKHFCCFLFTGFNFLWFAISLNCEVISPSENPPPPTHILRWYKFAILKFKSKSVASLDDSLNVVPLGILVIFIEVPTPPVDFYPWKWYWVYCLCGRIIVKRFRHGGCRFHRSVLHRIIAICNHTDHRILSRMIHESVLQLLHQLWPNKVGDWQPADTLQKMVSSHYNNTVPYGWINSELTIQVCVSIQSGTRDLTIACLDHNHTIVAIGLRNEMFNHGNPEYVMMLQ